MVEGGGGVIAETSTSTSNEKIDIAKNLLRNIHVAFGIKQCQISMFKNKSVQCNTI